MAINRAENGMVDIDADQVIRTQADITGDGQLVQRVMNVSGQLVPKVFNEIAVSYIVAGPGTGEIGSAIYKLNGVTVATLTLSYDGSNRLTNVVRA